MNSVVFFFFQIDSLIIPPSVLGYVFSDLLVTLSCFVWHLWVKLRIYFSKKSV